jgi:hypothetical protein
MASPAENTADTVTHDTAENFVNSNIIAITRAKIDADSAMACPISMDLKISPAIFLFLDMAKLASAAVCPSPIAAPIAPIPMHIPPPVKAATFTHI